MEEKRYTFFIPANFSFGVSVLGRSFPVRNVIDALLMSLISVGAVLLLSSGMSFTARLTALACTLIIVCAVALPGINGLSFSAFLFLFFSFHVKAFIRTHRKEKRPVERPLRRTEGKRYDDEEEQIFIPIRRKLAE